MGARKAGRGGICRGRFPKSRISASVGEVLAFPGKHGLACRKEGAGKWPGARRAMHDKCNYRGMVKTRPVGQFPAVFRALRARARSAGCPGTCGGSRRTIVRTNSEESALRGGGGESGRFRAWRLSPASPEEGIDSLGHDGRGARPAVSAGGLIAGPALCVHHDRSLRGKSEGLTIPFPSFSLLSKIPKLRNRFFSCRVNVYTSPLPPNTNANR